MIQGFCKSLFLTAALLLSGATSVPPEQSQQRSSTAVFAEVIKTLTDEARKAKIDQQLPRQKADFAESFDQSLPPELIGRKIIRQTNRDDFVDAYVRWQLTSFKPTLPKMNDKEFSLFVNTLPRLIENPMANDELLSDINKAIGAQELDEQTQEKLNSKLSEYIKKTSVAAALKKPNERLRNWILLHSPRTGARPIQVRLDHLSHTVRAGWPVENIKAKLDVLFKDSDRDKNFTIQQRQAIAKQAQRLIGMNHVFLARANISDGTISTDFDDSGVYDFDVKRWTRSILHN